ncbi:MAG: TRAP transporter substrate-binding protein DctP [Proteobacteria bacterium]|nr:TRAP transporter substrate-binding protein DctP [Pseudomonadota bacterium]
MSAPLTRRAFGAAATAGLAASLAAPFLRNAEAAAPLLLRCSVDTAPSHPRNIALRDFLAKVTHASDGRVQTRLFESGALFPDLHVVKALVQGQVELACPGTWTLTGFVPDADFSELPGLYGVPSAQVDKAVDGAAGTYVNGELTHKLGLQMLGGWLNWGFNAWFSTKKPITTLADLRGMKLRSPGGVLNSWRIRYFGGLPNVTAWPDVPLAMSQGNFDGLITTNESARTSKLYDSGMRHSLQDEQAFSYYAPMMNHAFWNKLGPKLQHAVLALWAENLPAYRANTAATQASARAALTAHGVSFADVSPAEREAVRRKMLPQQAKAAAEAHMSPHLVKLVMASVGT